MANRRRWLQFSLRGFIVVLTIGCVWLGWKVERARESERAIDAVRKAGCRVYYDKTGAMPPGNRLLANLLGERVTIFLGKPRRLDKTLALHLSHINSISRLNVYVATDSDLQHLEGLTNAGNITCHCEKNVTRDGLLKLQGTVPNTDIDIAWIGKGLEILRR
jgi:hypothetical protein